MAGVALGVEEKPEFRGVWVSSYGNNIDLGSPAAIDKLIADARAANLNALVVQVRKTGDAYYKSAYEPRADNLPKSDFDPLDYIIKKGMRRGWKYMLGLIHSKFGKEVASK